MITRSTRGVVPSTTMAVNGKLNSFVSQPVSFEMDEIALSAFWRKNTSNVEAIELANLLRALRKVVGHLGQNASSVEFLGMSRACSGIILDPAMATGSYPVPPAKVDFMVGLTVHEALHGIVWSDHVWKLLEPVFRRMGPREKVAFQKLIHTGEDIYVDCVANLSILGLYVEKARNAVLKEIGGKFPGKEPSVDELIHIWWGSAWGEGADRSQVTAYQQPLEELRQLTDGIKEVVRLETGVTDCCQRRAGLYRKTWQSLADSVALFRIIDKQLYWYPSSPETDKKEAATGSKKRYSVTEISPYLAERIQIELAAYSADITPIIRSIVASDEDEIAPTSRWDFNMPAHPLIDRKLVSRLSTIFTNYAEYKEVVSRGLTGGKLDRYRLYRAPINGRCFEYVDRIPNPEWTVTLLLDASGSMRGNKWKMVENTVGNLYAALANSRNRLQAYAYFEMDGVCMISSLIKGRRLLSVPPNGKTASGQAIIAAAYLMPKRQKRNLLIHVTDGETNFGCDVSHGINYCRKQSIHLVTLGCGYKDRAAMLRQYGKSIQFIDHFGQLPGAIESLLKWNFIYGKKPHLWDKHIFGMSLNEEDLYANQ